MGLDEVSGATQTKYGNTYAHMQLVQINWAEHQTAEDVNANRNETPFTLKWNKVNWTGNANRNETPFTQKQVKWTGNGLKLTQSGCKGA